VVVSLAGCGVKTIDTGHRGIETRFGKVVSESLPEGLYFYNPMTTDMVELDARIQKWESDTEAYTRDVQQAKIHFTMTYRLDPQQAHVIYQTVGRDWSEKLVPQVVVEEIKREIGQYEAVELIAKREQAARGIESLVIKNLEPRHVIVAGLQLTNVDFTQEFERAVEAKVVAQQRAIEEQNRTRQIEEQARQKVLSAEAEAKSIQIRAAALEKNPRLVELEAVQKWNGELPQYMLGGATPFINLAPPKP
jgi:regulator of protease activity HflC (stomatin/prohibitin superfamily)